MPKNSCKNDGLQALRAQIKPDLMQTIISHFYF